MVATIKRAIAVLAIVTVLSSNSCNEDRLWLDSGLRQTHEGRASFYAESTGRDSIGTIGTIFRLDGTVLAVGYFKDSSMARMDGPFVFYWPNGNVESMGAYEDGFKAGEWRRFSIDGTELTPRIYEPKAIWPFIQ